MNELKKQVRNPRENHTSPASYDCEFNCPRNGWIPFTASGDDTEFHGRLIYALIVDGLAGEIAPYEEENPDTDGDSNGADADDD